MSNSSWIRGLRPWSAWATDPRVERPLSDPQDDGPSASSGPAMALECDSSREQLPRTLRHSYELGAAFRRLCSCADARAVRIAVFRRSALSVVTAMKRVPSSSGPM